MIIRKKDFRRYKYKEIDNKKKKTLGDINVRKLILYPTIYENITCLLLLYKMI